MLLTAHFFRIMDWTELCCPKVAHFISRSRKHCGSLGVFLVALVYLFFRGLNIVFYKVLWYSVILDEKILVNGTMSNAYRKFLSQIFENCLSVLLIFSFIFYAHRCLWMTSSWWLVLRISLKMPVSSYLRLFVAFTSVSALSKNILIWLIFSTFILKISTYFNVTFNILVHWILFHFAFEEKGNSLIEIYLKFWLMFEFWDAADLSIVLSFVNGTAWFLKMITSRQYYDCQLLFKTVPLYH